MAPPRLRDSPGGTSTIGSLRPSDIYGLTQHPQPGEKILGTKIELAQLTLDSRTKQHAKFNSKVPVKNGSNEYKSGTRYLVTSRPGEFVKDLLSVLPPPKTSCTSLRNLEGLSIALGTTAGLTDPIQLLKQKIQVIDENAPSSLSTSASTRIPQCNPECGTHKDAGLVLGAKGNELSPRARVFSFFLRVNLQVVDYDGTLPTILVEKVQKVQIKITEHNSSNNHCFNFAKMCKSQKDVQQTTVTTYGEIHGFHA
ncbi:unnamed protein product [Acanthoscelides obtectus]|uniref:Uncharacterized protein n=1 Tax=Acanthoscelides obtectus TaxID=200917 RepID=A0A9P0JIA7_ACAOB|nr:unnamed protein product [Acanthoscelides obtectus]CAK1661534.1 hypothetical protein AOBTE_LOCUS22672 [Acanthoscelides obtectus]